MGVVLCFIYFANDIRHVVFMSHSKLVTDLERRAAAVRPAGRNSGTQKWQHLLFLHWEVPFESVRQLVPPELEIDTFDGRCFVGLVPFRMREIRPAWLPRQLAFNFFETNVRTYVHYRGRPGVYFFSLDANSRLAVWAARLGWSLPYFYATMNGTGPTSEPATSQFNRWTYSCDRRGLKSHVDFQAPTALATATVGTLEYFLLERYYLFVQRKKQIYVGQVHHEPYPFATAELGECRDQLIAAAGFPTQGQAPSLVHYSPGVDVEVFAIKRPVP